MAIEYLDEPQVNPSTRKKIEYLDEPPSSPKIEYLDQPAASDKVEYLDQPELSLGEKAKNLANIVVGAGKTLIKGGASVPQQPFNALEQKFSEVSPEVLKGESPFVQAAFGTARGLNRVVGSLATPENLAILGSMAVAPPVLGAIASGYFSFQMFKQMPEQAKAYIAAIHNGDTSEAARLATEFGATGAMAASAGEHALDVKPKPASFDKMVKPSEADVRNRFTESAIRPGELPLGLPSPSEAGGAIPLEYLDEPTPRQKVLADAQKVHELAKTKQPILEQMGNDVSNELGLEGFVGKVKTPESITDKVMRKDNPDYTVNSPKDHARGTILLNDFAETPKVVDALKQRGQFTGEESISEPLNAFGYRGIHLTTDLGDGINGEIQIHTPESWALKKQTDDIYKSWRAYEKVDLNKESPKVREAAKRDMDRSRRLWDDFWSKQPQAAKDAAASSVRGLDSNTSPKVPSNLTQPEGPSTSAESPLSIGPTSKILPSANRENLSENLSIDLPSNKSISPEAGKVNPRIEYLDESGQHGAVINPVFATTELVRLARESKTYKDFENAVSRHKDLMDTVQFYKTNLQDVYQKKDEQPGVDFKAKQLASPEFKKWFGDSKVVDEKGQPQVVYHGTQRPDRIGGRFQKSRATSGPMSYFTDNAEVASSYAKGKPDTSLYNEDSNYRDWFKVKAGRSKVNIEQHWNQLPYEERQRLAEILPKITILDPETGAELAKPVVLKDQTAVAGKDHWDHTIKEKRGNVLAAAVDIWLDAGTLYGREEMFGDILREAGIKNFEYDSPHREHSAVYPTYLNIKNPLETSNVPAEVVSQLERASRFQRPASEYGPDQWAKTRRDASEWIQELKNDVANGTSLAWTSIPDWVTRKLKEMGYDGVRDEGGKYGGEKHDVWVPFEPTQIKSATGNSGRFDIHNPDIRGAVLNPAGVLLDLAQKAKESETFAEFRKKILESKDLNDTVRYWNLNLRDIYAKKDEQKSQEAGTAGSAGKSEGKTPFFVNDAPLNFTQMKEGANPKAVYRDVRQTYAGAKNAQVVTANHLADAVRKILPDETQREGLTLLRDTGGDRAALEAALKDKKFEEHWPALKAALAPTLEMQKANALLEQYYKETGEAGKKYGFLGEVRDNYINRLYKPDPPDTKINTETYRPGLAKTTGHAKSRVFDTLLDAIKYGKEPATLDAADLVSIHGGEFAKTLTNNKLLQSLETTGLGMKIESGKLPAGFARIGNSNFAVPDWLATGLKAITEPNFMNRIDELRGIKKYQGLIKTIDLSVSLFHHFTMAMQTVYQGSSQGLNLKKITTDFYNDPDFQKIEKDFSESGGMTSNIDANKDILYKLTKNDGLVSRFYNNALLKPGFKAIEFNNEFLFGRVQRWMKVVDYGKRISDWIEKHPNAMNADIVEAKRGIAKQVNAAYGGLNWEALGYTPSVVSALRLALLAPDWALSNFYIGKYAISHGGTEGAASRANLFRGIVGGAILTELANKTITGHYTNKNKKGHEMEIEIRPNVFISVFRGAPGEVLKLINKTRQEGALVGPSSYAQGKLSPIARFFLGLASNTDYYGRPIANKKKTFGQNTLSGAKFAASSLGPVPFSLTSLKDYLDQGGKDPIGGLLTLSGLARAGHQKKVAWK